MINCVAGNFIHSGPQKRTTVFLLNGRSGYADAQGRHAMVAIQAPLDGCSARSPAPPNHRKGPVTGPFLLHALVVVRRQALGLVNGCRGHADLDVGADRDPEAIGFGHDELDHPDLDAVRRLDNSVEPERSQPGDLKPCVRWHVIADVRKPGDLEIDEHRAGIAEGQGSIDV
jgi:hypothetical protein